MSKMTAVQFAAYVKKDAGYDEGRNNANKYAAIAGHANNQAWCASFVSAKLIEAGVYPKGHSILSASSRTMYDVAVRKKKLGVKAQDVQVGDIAHLIRGPIKSWKGHVGIVTRVIRDAKGRVVQVETVEGNSSGAGHAHVGGAVLIQTRKVTFWGLGFWRPNYAVTAPVKPPVVTPPPPIVGGVIPKPRTELEKTVDRLVVAVAAIEKKLASLQPK